MSKTLLLADDSVVIQKLVGLSFANEDVELVSTDNGDDAVTKAREIRPDVVLADVVMPGKSGYEVCEAIKNDPTLAHVPVLLLTGTFEAFDESRAASVGADGHITKPFEAQALVERVKTVIKNAARTAAAMPPAIPAASMSPAAPAPAARADEIFFDDAEPLVAPTSIASLDLGEDLGQDFSQDFSQDLAANDGGFLGRSDSLDVTPSLSESDLSDGLDGDLFGPPGEIGGPSFGSPVAPIQASESTPVVDADRFADAPIEDATIAFLPESAPALGGAGDARAAIADDLGFDDPLELAPLPTSALDLDSAFDPAPPSAAKIQVALDDASATTSRSFGQVGGVTDLDELLAAPPSIAVAPPAAARIEHRPEPPVLLDFGPSEQSTSDLDFGFDVSEQAPLAKVDLLEESFSSMLDVSESQLLGDPPPPPLPRMAPIATPIALEPEIESIPATDYDVSSSDLATAIATAIAPPELPAPAMIAPPPLPPRVARPEPDLDLDLFLEAPKPPSEPAFSAASTRAFDPAASAEGLATARRTVDDLSPILQQRVHETLEKVAWEAFSDLSEQIVKQVIERVERIAWEVIPQMAETLVREEIRKLKGEGD